MSEERLRVLLVDDEESLRVPLKKYLEDNFGYHVDPVASGEEALRLVEEAGGRYDVALIDDLLTPKPGEEPRPIGIELMSRIKERYPEMEAVVFTGWSGLPDWDKDRILKALRAGAFRYLKKPFDNNELAMLIRTAAQQVRLREIGRAILSERELERVLEGIAGAACSLAMADEAAIALLDQATGKIRVHARTHPGEQEWKRHFKDRDLSKEIIQSGQIVYVQESMRASPVDPKVIEAGIHSFLGLPIPGEGGNLGVLYVYSYRPGRFDEGSTVAVLQTLAWQAGLAIANARAFRQIRVHAGYMEALVRAGQGFTRATTEEELLAFAWDFVQEQLKVSTFFVALYDRQVDMLRFPLHYDEGQLVPIPDRPLGDNPEQWGIAGHVVKTGQEFHWPTDEEKRRRCESLGIKSVQFGKACESCFFLPLKAGDDVIGVMSIQSYDLYAFSPVLLDACRALGSQLAVALESARLFEAEARRRQEAETLREAALALTTTLEREKVFENILAELQKVVPYDSASVQLLKGDRLEIIGGRGFPNLPELLGISFPIDGDNPNREVVRRRVPFIVADARAAYKGFTQEPHVQAGIRGWLGVPMLLGDRLIGMIALDKREPSFYTEEHARLAQAFATQAAIAIENARLFQEAKEGRDYIRSLYEASSAIIAPTEPGQVLQAVVNTACRTTGVWRAIVLLVDEGEEPRMLAQSGFDDHLELATAIRPRGISRQVIQTRQPRFFPDTQIAAGEVHPEMITEGVQAAACLPLLLRDRAIGVLWIHYREVHPFSEAEQQALQVYAGQAAIAHDHARRMRELEHLRLAAAKLVSAAGIQEVLQQIVDSAREVLEADSAVIWSYDSTRNVFFPDELKASGIDPALPERFRSDEPKPGGTAETVMKRGYIPVTDINDPQYDFLGPGRGLREEIGIKAFQGISLQVGEDKLGVLYVNYVRPRGFSAEDRATLETFAYHATLALKRARLLEQVQKAKRTAEAVARVTTLENCEVTLQSVVQGTRHAIDCDAVTLYTYNQATGKLDHPPTMVGVRYPERATRLGTVAPDSIIYLVLRRDEPYIAERAYDDPLFKNTRFTVDEEIKSCVAIPLQVGNQKVGIMFVNYRTQHRFTEEELANIRHFADQAAVAIRNAQLFEQTVRRTASLQALYEAGKALSGTLTLGDVLNRIVEQAWQLTGRYGKQARFSHLALKEGNRLRFKAAYPPEHLPGLQRGVGDIDLESDKCIGITGRAVKIGRSQLVGDVTQNPDYIAYDPETRSELAVPIKVGEEVIGVLNVEHPNHNAFDEDDRRDLESLATQAALAIQNARQYEELRRTKGLVGARTALAWMGMASSAWRHAIDKHALTIQEQARLLREDLQEFLSRKGYARVDRRLDMIKNLATRILEKPIVPPLSAEERVAQVVVNDLVGERTRQLWQNEPYRGVELQLELCLDEGGTVRVSPEWLRRAFDILVDNAVDAVADCDVRKIAIGTREAGTGVEIIVADTGPGIPGGVVPKLGLEPIEKPEGVKGLGMGLLMAQTIVQTYGGEIQVDSTGPSGTTMVIWLPRER
ncbi:MAG: GAF domain-containing protein [Anaerolineae bacterium]